MPFPPQDPLEAFQRWQKLAKHRSVHLPKCSKCGGATPSGELKRWGVCGICAMNATNK